MDQVERFSQAYQQAPWRTQIQMLGMFSLVLVFVALVSGIYLNLSSRKAETGREIQEMRASIIELKRSNASLTSQLATLYSTQRMVERADDLGFEPVAKEEIVYLAVEGYTPRQPVYLAQKTQPQLAGGVVLPPQYTESLLEWLARKLVSYSISVGR